MSVDVTKQGLLHIVIDSSGYKDMTAGFPISQLDMVFDATYNTCDTTVTEGEIKGGTVPGQLGPVGDAAGFSYPEGQTADEIQQQVRLGGAHHYYYG